MLLLFSAAGSAADFDLVIKNGRVMDPETGFDQIANVGVNNGFITEISSRAARGLDP